MTLECFNCGGESAPNAAACEHCGWQLMIAVNGAVPACTSAESDAICMLRDALDDLHFVGLRLEVDGAGAGAGINVWRNESPDTAPVLLARIPAGEMLLGATQHPEG